jgi:hypothetical protein
MYDDDSMREVLDAVRAAVPEDRMRTPVQHIASAARSRRRRRGLAGLAGTGLAVAAGVALALPAMGAGHSTPAAGAGHRAPAARASTAELTGWTVRTEANGTVVVTVAQLGNKAELQRVLAEHGIPAVVYAGPKECDVADSEVALGGRAMKPSTSVIDGRSQMVLDIKPSAMPRGTEMLFNIVTNKAGVVRGGGGELIYDGAPVTCTPAQY